MPTVESIRTQYRKKRISLLEDLISVAIQLIKLNAYQLEKINLQDFKNLKKDAQNMLQRARDV